MIQVVWHEIQRGLIVGYELQETIRNRSMKVCGHDEEQKQRDWRIELSDEILQTRKTSWDCPSKISCSFSYDCMSSCFNMDDQSWESVKDFKSWKRTSKSRGSGQQLTWLPRRTRKILNWTVDIPERLCLWRRYGILRLMEEIWKQEEAVSSKRFLFGCRCLFSEIASYKRSWDSSRFNY